MTFCEQLSLSLSHSTNIISDTKAPILLFLSIQIIAQKIFRE